MLPMNSPLRVKISHVREGCSIYVHTDCMLNRGRTYKLYNTTNFTPPTPLEPERDALGLVDKIVAKARLKNSGITEIEVRQNVIMVSYSPAADDGLVDKLINAAIRTAGVPHVFV